MWIDSLMSSLETSTSMVLGMVSAGQDSGMVWRTMFSTPPFFRPGETSWPWKCTGMSSLTVEPSAKRMKSTCTGRSLTGSSCTSRGITRVFLPAMSSMKRVVRKWPASTWRSRVRLSTVMFSGVAVPP